MPSIDERVVAMAFENAKFEAGVAQTMRTLSKLDATLQQIGSRNSLADIEKAANKVTLEQPMSALDKLKARFSNAGQGAAEGFNEIEKAGNKVTLEQPVRALNKVQGQVGQVGAQAADGFNEIEKASNRVNLQGLNSAMDSVTAKFSVIQGAATVAFGNISSQAALKGGSFAKSFSFGPIQQGFEEYQTNLGSIQTIMANTEGQRISGLGATNKALNELNHYSDQTIYNFSQMARNIGTFTAAGVDLKTSTASIKGIANLAALSGSNAQQASTAMYQLSQAIASGKVGLQDWNSVVNAGMGGRKFQNSLIQTGVAMGTIEKGAVKIDKATGKATINGQSFRESIMAAPGKRSWLTSEVLTGSLEQFTGDMTDAELRAKGFSDAQIKSIQATAQTAKKAATEVKTLPQVFDVAREAIGSGWALTFQNIFGNFTEAKKLFTGLSQSINNVIGQNAKARNKVLAEWKKGGGRIDFIEGIKNAFKALMGILKPIGQAFRDVFPRKTSDDLIAMTKRFREFTADLKPSAEVMDGLRRTARGFFAVLHIGWSIVKGLIGVIGDLLGVVGHGSGGFLNFTGSIGDFLVAVDNALTKGGLLTGFFDGLSTVLKLPLQLLTGLASAIGQLFGGVDAGAGDKLSGSMGKVKGAADPLARALDSLKQAWDGFVHILKQAKDLVSPWMDKIGEQLSRVGEFIGDAFKGENFDKTMTVLSTGFIGGIFLALKKAITGVSGSFVGILKPLNGALGALTGNLKAMQANVKAQTILLIATAIGVLAASTFALAQIDPEGLSRAMTAISIGLGQLVGALAILGKVSKGGAFLTMPILAASLILLASSLVIMAAAAKIFATMSWEEIAKGLIGIGGGLAAIAVGMKAMGPGTIIQAPALLLLAVALNAIALAMKQFAGLSWEELAKGIVGVMGSLAAMIAPLSGVGPMLTIAAPGVIAIAFALNMLAGAVKSFGEMSWGDMIKGLVGATLALAGIGIAINAIPPHAALLGAGLLVVAVGLGGVAAAVKAFGSMSIGELTKGLIAMGGALGILAVGLTAMTAGLPGAAALVIAAGALALLTPTLGFLGTLNWGTIFKGLAAIALTLGTLAIAGSIAAPGLLLLGTALLPLGLAFTVVAAAAYLFSLAISKVANDGAKGVGILIGAIAAFIAVLPKLVIDLLKGLVDIVAEVAKIAPQVADSLIKIATTLIGAVIQLTPKIAQAIGTLVQQLLVVIVRDSPKLIQAGITLILNLLKGIDQNIGQVVTRMASIITKFLSTLTSKTPALTAAGARFLVAFLNGIAQHIGDVARAGIRIVTNFLSALLTLPTKLVGVAVRGIVGFIKALGQKIPRVVSAAIEMAGKFVRAVAHGLVRLAEIGADAVIDFMHGIARVIRTKGPELRRAGWDIATALVDGFVDGLKAVAKKPIDAVNDLFGGSGGIAKEARKSLEIRSPSKVFMEIGKMVVLGLAVGIGDNAGQVSQAAKNVVDATKIGLAQGLIGIGSILSSGITNPLRAMLRENRGIREFGKFLGGEFRQGLTGGLWDDGKSEARRQIEGSFKALKVKLGEENGKLREQLRQDQDELKQLMSERDKNWGKINGLRQRVAQEKGLLAQSKSATEALMRSMRGEQSILVQLAANYEKVTKKLEDAKAKLDQLKSDRKQAIQDYTDQFSQLPDLGSLIDNAVSDAAMTWADRWEALRAKQQEDQQRSQIDQVALYKQSLQEQIAATTKYMETLSKLRAIGLDDATFKKLLSMGTAGQEFASQLLRGGKGSVDQINALDNQLAKAAGDLGTKAGHELYDAGIQAGQGLVDGLKKQQSEIRKVMETIAKSMVFALKLALGIRSPSRVFAELGQFSAQGLVDGLTASSSLVQDAATGIGNDATDALRKSLANVSDRVQNDIDTDLTITPVLDLTQVQKDASKIQDLANVVPITAAASYGQASAISQETQVTAAAQADKSAQPSIEVNLEQNNTSPKALDDVEIYRQTRNQLSQVKSALGLTTQAKP